MVTAGAENPVEGSPPQSGAAPIATAEEVAGELSPEEMERRRAALAEIVDLMREAIQMDGGDLVLTRVDYGAGIVDVELRGACGSCAISSMTLRAGVDRMLKERLEWVREVHGEVDESLDYFESEALGRGAYVPKYY
jgi:Fe-S cluster biogenesis protein NfuA